MDARMKRLLLPLALLLCLAACARVVPRAAEAAVILPEPTAEAPSEALTTEAIDRLRALLAEAQTYSGVGETAGSSLRLFVLAGRLLDWQAETGASASAAEAAARDFASELGPEAREALQSRLETLSAAALALCAGDTGAMEDGGYLPCCLPWEETTARAFFAALCRGVKSEYSEKESGKMNIFPLLPLREAEKFAMIQQK